MGSEMKIHFSDEEEDLESLRLAALSSLKKKNELNEIPLKQQYPNEKTYKNMYRGGKRRFFPNQNGRMGRNGQFINPVRNSNLISIPTVTEPETSLLKSTKFTKNEEEAPKLIRPQDRYANAKEESENGGPSSKFDRYDNSNSDSEEEDEITGSKIERSNSLEALMEELDAEIQGERKVEEVSEEKPKESVIQEEIVSKKSENEVPEPESEEVKTVELKQPEIYVKPKHKSPKRHINRRINGRVFNPEPNFIPNPMLIQNFPPQFTTVYNAVPSFSGPEIFPMNVPPPTFLPPPIPTHLPPYPAPLQPLIIEPQPVPMGPLSPRSAAFVLENRAIVEKRKRSPSRRSYSRSPSPHRSRFSKTPPLRRSPSPVRRSPLRRSLSPAGNARRSPVRRSLSPYRKYRDRTPPKRVRDSPKRCKESPKKSHKIGVKERLGAKSKEEKNVKKKEEIAKDEAKSLDPVLEARKKKFESNEIKVKEGVIRLKPKDENNETTKQKENEKPKVKKLRTETVEKPHSEEQSTRIVLLPKNEAKTPPLTPQQDQLEEAMNELEMLLKDDEALELTAKVDDLFTDEETDQENEGRFKAKMKDDKTSTVVPLKRLANGTKTERRKKPKEPLTNPIENRKIEIKIRNPAKYEKAKVQVSSRMSEDEESEPEIIVENEEDEELESRDGDLRAQLSRKRAERQNKHPTVEGIQSRLLQSALEGAVFKKKRSKKKEKEIKEYRMIGKLIGRDLISGTFDFTLQSDKNVKFYKRFEIPSQLLPDVKVPIHLRLGVANDSDVKIPRKKAKKRKHALLEQV